MIETVEVTKSFNVGTPRQWNALRGISLNIEAGGITVIRGPSGSGKTTLLSLIGCMARPTSGRIFLERREITSLPEPFLASIRRHNFGFIFQRLNLISGMTAAENVMIPAYPTGKSYTVLENRALDLLQSFGLEEKVWTKVEHLSGGEAQRVAVARALMNDPTVIIADEPTAQVDSAMSEVFMEMMYALSLQGKTIIIASHDPIVYGSPMVHMLVEMRDGLLTEGSP